MSRIAEAERGAFRTVAEMLLAAAVRLHREPLGMRLTEALVVVAEEVSPRIGALRVVPVVHAVPLEEPAVAGRILHRCVVRLVERVGVHADLRKRQTDMPRGKSYPAHLQLWNEIKRQVRADDPFVTRNHLAVLARPKVAAAERFEKIRKRMAHATRRLTAQH